MINQRGYTQRPVLFCRCLSDDNIRERNLVRSNMRNVVSAFNAGIVIMITQPGFVGVAYRVLAEEQVRDGIVCCLSNR